MILDTEVDTVRHPRTHFGGQEVKGGWHRLRPAGQSLTRQGSSLRWLTTAKIAAVAAAGFGGDN